MNYQTQFLDAQALRQLRESTLRALTLDDANEDVQNAVELSGIDTIIHRIAAHVNESTGTAVDFLNSSIALVCDATANFGRQPGMTPNWHTDQSNRWVNGDCFNVCMPLYNDAIQSGLSIISGDDNKELYQQLGDQSYPISIYSRQKNPTFFKMLPPNTPEYIDLLILNGYEGTIAPMSSSTINISTFEQLCPGDIGVYKHSDIHGSFLKSGMRIELTLKFKALDASLNRAHSNELFPTFNNMYTGLFGHPKPKNDSEELIAFDSFRKQFLYPEKRAKHEFLKVELIRAMLKKMLAN
jgi:hypothetical protein